MFPILAILTTVLLFSSVCSSNESYNLIDKLNGSKAFQSLDELSKNGELPHSYVEYSFTKSKFNQSNKQNKKLDEFTLFDDSDYFASSGSGSGAGSGDGSGFGSGNGYSSSTIVSERIIGDETGSGSTSQSVIVDDKDMELVSNFDELNKIGNNNNNEFPIMLQESSNAKNYFDAEAEQFYYESGSGFGGTPDNKDKK